MPRRPEHTSTTKTRLRGGRLEPLRRDGGCWDEQDGGPDDLLFNLEGDPTMTPSGKDQERKSGK